MAKRDKSHKSGELELNLTETQDIIGRLKEALSVKSDGQLANYLGITRQNIGAARKRDDVPPGWIYKVAEITGCSMDWLRFGHGPKIRADYVTGGTQPDGQLASTESSYDLQVSWKPRSANELKHVEDSSGFGAAVEMLAKIFSSGDKLLISAISTNIRAFCEAIDRQRREQRAIKELENLKSRLTTIEKQLQQAGSSGKKARKSNK